jgi:hypothetical protein
MLALLNIDLEATFLEALTIASSFLADFFTILVFDFFLAAIGIFENLALVW